MSISSVNGSMSTFGLSVQITMMLSKLIFLWFILEVSSYSYGTGFGIGREDHSSAQGDSVLQKLFKSLLLQRSSWEDPVRTVTDYLRPCLKVGRNFFSQTSSWSI